jgi:hypothetical protein
VSRVEIERVLGRDAHRMALSLELGLAASGVSQSDNRAV